MKIFSWNVNGIRAVEKKNLFEPFIEAHQPDILCLQETKAREDSVVEYFGEKYQEYQQFWYAADRPGYSGTAIFTKKAPESVLLGISDRITKDFTLNDSYGDTTKEGRVTTLEFADYFVTSVYTPNAKDDLSRIPMRLQWDPAFLTYMKFLSKKKPIIFCGDFNVAHTPLDLARPKENEGKKGFTKEERKGFGALLEAGFVDSLRNLYPLTPGLYTWWSHFGNARARNVGWRIDYILLSPSLQPLLRNAKVHAQIEGSDHCPVSVDLNIDI